jgi:hypothetical protein
MHHPHVILRIDPHAHGGAKYPMIRERLWPKRIDLEDRRLRGTASLRRHVGAKQAGNEAERKNNHERSRREGAVAGDE